MVWRPLGDLSVTDGSSCVEGSPGDVVPAVASLVSDLVSSRERQTHGMGSCAESGLLVRHPVVSTDSCVFQGERSMASLGSEGGGFLMAGVGCSKFTGFH